MKLASWVAGCAAIVLGSGAIVANAEPEATSSVTFTAELVDATGEGAIIADKGAVLRILCTNAGATESRKVRVRAVPETDAGFVAIPSLTYLGDVAPGASASLRVPILAGKNLGDGTASVQVSVLGGSGGLLASREFMFRTAPWRQARLRIGAAAFVDPAGRRPEAGRELLVQVAVVNQGNGAARQTKLSLVPPPGIELLDDPLFEVGEVGAGQTRVARFPVFIPRTWSGQSVPFQVGLEEPRLPAPIVATVKAALGGDSAVVVAAPGSEQPAPTLDALLVPPVSEIDRPPAVIRPPDRDSVGLVIGVERYGKKVPPAPFATRDAAAMRMLFQKRLGIPPENLIALVDDQATKGGMETAIESLLPALVSEGKSRLYVFFAGHGTPDPDTKEPYLVPFDGNPAFAKASCYPLSRLYQQIARAGARSAVVLLDASFNGLAGRTREVRSVLAQARPLAVKFRQEACPRNVSVIAACRSDQASAVYPEMRHGLFTYFAAKALRDHASIAESAELDGLYEYVEKQLPPAARRLGRTQSPDRLGSK